MSFLKHPPYLFFQRRVFSPVTIFLLIASFIVVYSASFHPGGIKDGEKKMKNKVKNEPRSTVRGVSKGYYVRRTRTRRKYRHRSRNPITNPPTKITNVPSLGKKICRNHTRVSRIQDEPCALRASSDVVLLPCRTKFRN